MIKYLTLLQHDGEFWDYEFADDRCCRSTYMLSYDVMRRVWVGSFSYMEEDGEWGNPMWFAERTVRELVDLIPRESLPMVAWTNPTESIIGMRFSYRTDPR